MEQRQAVWRGGTDRQLWLATLIDAMEEAVRPEVRVRPCAPEVLSRLRAQLARPAPRHRIVAPVFCRRR